MVQRVNEIWRLLEEMQGQIAAEIRVMLGEAPIASSNFTEEDKQRRILAMKECAARSTSDEERHDAWIKMHVDSGWVYGEEFNSEKKTHPNLKPWNELPATVRSKARIFDIVSKAGAKIAMEERDPNDSPLDHYSKSLSDIFQTYISGCADESMVSQFESMVRVTLMKYTRLYAIAVGWPRQQVESDIRVRAAVTALADACTAAMVNGVATFHDMMTREADRVLSKAAGLGE